MSEFESRNSRSIVLPPAHSSTADQPSFPLVLSVPPRSLVVVDTKIVFYTSLIDFLIVPNCDEAPPDIRYNESSSRWYLHL